jgi:hypothetical protein
MDCECEHQALRRARPRRYIHRPLIPGGGLAKLDAALVAVCLVSFQRNPAREKRMAEQLGHALPLLPAYGRTWPTST